MTITLPIHRLRYSNKWLALLSVWVLLICLFYTYAGVYLVPYPGFDLTNEKVISLEPCENDSPACEVNRQQLQVGDQILSIGDLTDTEIIRDRSTNPFANYEPGDSVPITVLRQGEMLTIDWQIQGPTTQGYLRRLSYGLIFIPFWLAGTLILLFLYPHDLRWQLLIAFNYVTAIWLAVGVHSSMRIVYASQVQHALAWLLAPIYLHLHLLVPIPLFRRSWRYFLYPLYGIAAVAAVLELFQALPSAAFNLGLLLAVLGSFCLLVYRLSTVRPMADRQATRLMLAGIGLAFGPGIALVVIPTLFQVSLPPGLSQYVVLFAVPLLPFFYIYALYKRYLGDQEFRANQLLGLYSFNLVYLSVLILMLVVINHVFRSSNNLTLVHVAVASIFVVVAPWLRGRFQEFVDRLAYGVVHDSQNIIRTFANQLPTVLDRETLVQLLVGEILPSLYIRQSALYLITDGQVEPIYTYGIPQDGYPDTAQQIQGLLAEAGQYRKPSETTQREFDWVRLAIALKVREKNVGIWLFGRRDPDDYYPRNDITLLTTLGSQVAVAMENARLYAESISHTEQLQILHVAKQAMASTLDTDTLRQILVHSARQLVRAQYSGLTSYDAEGNLIVPITDGLTAAERSHLTQSSSVQKLQKLVLTQDQVLRLDEQEQHSPLIDVSYNQIPVETLLVVPVAARGKVIGNLYVADKEDGQLFSDEDEKQLLSLAAGAALALENARLFQETNKRLAELETLFAVSKKLAYTHELTAILQLVVDHVCTSIPAAERAIIHLVNPARDRLVPQAVSGKETDLAAIPSFSSGQGIWGQTIAAQDLVYIEDASTLTEVWQMVEPTRSLALVPLIVDETMVGTLSLASTAPDAFSADKRRLLTSLGHQTAVAIKKAQITDNLRESLAALKERSAELEDSLSQLRETQVQLIQSAKLASLGTLSAGIAHELNNPLAGIKSYTQNLLYSQQRHALTQEMLCKNLQGIDSLVNKSAQIIQNFRSFSRHSSGDFEPLDVNQPLEDALSMLGEQLRLRDITVFKELSPNLPLVKGNAVQIEQVLVNLIGNARDAMAESTHKELRLRTCTERDKVVVEVSDSGYGIQPEFLNKVFDPFFTTKEVGQGTGLGLSISHGIVKQHGGNIEVCSSAEMGTTFRVILPICSQEQNL